MQLTEAVLQALATLWGHKLRSFFTLLGIIVSVAFLIAVVAVIQGMNAYVRERLAGAIVGVNAFQIRRDPIQVGFIDDEEWRKIQRRPIIAPEDFSYVARALPDAQAISLQSGWPTPMADVQWRNRTVGGVLVFGGSSRCSASTWPRSCSARPSSPWETPFASAVRRSRSRVSSPRRARCWGSPGMGSSCSRLRPSKRCTDGVRPR